MQASWQLQWQWQQHSAGNYKYNYNDNYGNYKNGKYDANTAK